MKFNCTKCDYQTDSKSNYNRHLKTKEHNNKSLKNTAEKCIIDYTDYTDDYTEKKDCARDCAKYDKRKDDSNNTIFECEKCGKKLTNYISFYRHKGKTCKMRNISKLTEILDIDKKVTDEYINKPQIKQKKIEEMSCLNETNNKMKSIETEIENKLKMRELEVENRMKSMEDRMKSMETEIENKLKVKELEMEIKMLKERNEQLNKLVESKSNQTINIKKMSVKNYANKYYANAPPLKPLESYTLFDDQFTNLIDDIVCYYKNGKLHETLGKFIVEQYKKDDPEKQSLWITDVSRVTYLIREVIDNNNVWNFDYKGARTNSYIINPLIVYLKNHMDKFSQELPQKIKSVESKEVNKMANNMSYIMKMTKDIDDGLLANDIIRYIAPFFSLNIDKNNLSNS